MHSSQNVWLHFVFIGDKNSSKQMGHSIIKIYKCIISVATKTPLTFFVSAAFPGICINSYVNVV